MLLCHVHLKSKTCSPHNSCWRGKHGLSSQVNVVTLAVRVQRLILDERLSPHSIWFIASQSWYTRSRKHSKPRNMLRYVSSRGHMMSCATRSQCWAQPPVNLSYSHHHRNIIESRLWLMLSCGGGRLSKKTASPTSHSQIQPPSRAHKHNEGTCWAVMVTRSRQWAHMPRWAVMASRSQQRAHQPPTPLDHSHHHGTAEDTTCWAVSCDCGTLLTMSTYANITGTQKEAMKDTYWPVTVAHSQRQAHPPPATLEYSHHHGHTNVSSPGTHVELWWSHAPEDEHIHHQPLSNIPTITVS
jgi:hypothetical protein